MAKYIGTYDNETAIATAVNNNELSRPFVALAEDTSRVYYGPYVDLAVIGDICVYDTTTQSLRFIHQADYNTTTYPTATYEPIGVIVTDQTASLAGGVDRTVKILAKNWLDKSNPDTGNANRQSIEWGDNTVGAGATSTTDGKANTATVLTFATGQANWRTDATILYTSDSAAMYPLFECAWRYHTSGTAQGDWYIGAKDELNTLVSDSTAGAVINSGFTAIGASVYYGSGNIGSSTEYGSIGAWYWSGNYWDGVNKNSGNKWCSRAICEKAVLPINA